MIQKFLLEKAKIRFNILSAMFGDVSLEIIFTLIENDHGRLGFEANN